MNGGLTKDQGWKVRLPHPPGARGPDQIAMLCQAAWMTGVCTEDGDEKAVGTGLLWEKCILLPCAQDMTAQEK